MTIKLRIPKAPLRRVCGVFGDPVDFAIYLNVIGWSFFFFCLWFWGTK